MAVVKQSSFARGEIAPALYGRADLTAYQLGLHTCLNWTVRKDGTLENRAGSEWIGAVKDPSKATRLLRFVFNDAQTYVLEFGDLYARIWRAGALLECPSIGPEWSNATTYQPGDVVADSTLLIDDGVPFICQVATTNEIPHSNNGVGKPWRRAAWDNAFPYAAGDIVTAGGDFYIATAASTNQDPTSSSGYWSPVLPLAPDLNPIIEIPTPYTAAELFDLRFVQSNDVVTITHQSHAPREFCRLGTYNWCLRTINTDPAVTPPSAVQIAGSAGGVLTQYLVTAVDLVSRAESLPGAAHTAAPIAVSSVSWTGTQLAFTTGAAHGIASGSTVVLSGFTALGRTSQVHVFPQPVTYVYNKGLIDLNGNRYILDSTGANTFVLRGVLSADYLVGSPTTGVVAPVGAGGGAFATPTTADPITVSWAANPLAAQFNVYKAVNGVYGYIGTSTTNSFLDDGITPNTGETPPEASKVFTSSEDYPAICAYIQQRLGFADTIAKPYLVELSRVADYHNFTTRRVLQDDDAVSFGIAGDEVQSVNGMADLAGKLLLFASNGVYTVQGDSDGVIKPSAINLRRQSSVGSAALAPLVIDTSALYVEARGYAIRDLQYQLANDGYGGDDLSTMSAHLVTGKTIVEWAYQRTPQSIVWMVLSDGSLIALTYVRSQQVIAWHRHDVGGLVESCTVVPEGNEDALYLIVRRTINGATKRYIERLHSRLVTDVTVDAFFVDCGLSFDGTNSTAAHHLTLSGGTTWAVGETLTLTATWSAFAAGNVGSDYILTVGTDAVRVRITGYTNATHVTVQPLTDVPAALRAVATATWSTCPLTLAGLGHLEGQTVAVLVDGNEHAPVVVTAGAITLTRGGVHVHVGLPIVADAELLDIEDPQGATLLGKQKNVARAVVIAVASRGLFVGPDAAHLDEAKLRTTEAPGVATQPVTGQIDVRLTTSWNNNGRVLIRQTAPLPAQILAVARDGQIGG